MDPIYYYKPNLPEQPDYLAYLQSVWDRNVLTNNGECVVDLEQKLAGYLNVRHVVLVSSGTIGLQIAYKVAGFRGKILTTPFSFLASTSSLVWEHCEPLYRDIDSASLVPDFSQLNPADIDGLMPVQIFGMPVKLPAQTPGFPIVVDGAQSFGVFRDGVSILADGDLGVMSLHATKFFHTVEGGAIVTNNDGFAQKARAIRNFGRDDSNLQVLEVGINAKLSELHAAMGLALFNRIPALLERNRAIYASYSQAIQDNPSGCFAMPYIDPAIRYSYAYFPLLCRDAAVRRSFSEKLHKEQVGHKVYAGNSLNELFYVGKTSCPVSENVCDRILSMPLYAGMTDAETERVSNLIREFKYEHA